MDRHNISLAIAILVCYVSVSIDGQPELNRTFTFSDFLVQMKPSSFEKLLFSDPPVRIFAKDTEYHGQIVTNVFNKFLLNFDFVDESDTSYIQLQSICSAAAMYNQITSRVGNTRFLELFISIIPHNTITNQLNMVSSIILETNLAFNGTVKSFILNYRPLRLGPQTLPLVNQDIQLANEFLKMQHPQTLSIILEPRNCIGSDEYFSNLPIQFIDTFMFLSVLDLHQNEVDVAAMFSCFLMLLKVVQLRPTYGFGAAGLIPLWNNKTFVTDQYAAQILETLNNFSELLNLVPVMIEDQDETSSNMTEDSVMQSSEALENWLRQDPAFNKQFTGISIYDKNHLNGKDTEMLVTSIWRTVVD